MLEEVLNNLHNYFCVGVNRGRFAISSGMLDVPGLIPGQYFRVVGSVLNDGVYKYPAADLIDEEFTGEIWALAVPRAVLQLAEEIQQWREKNPETDKTSESFGGYSYSRASGSSGAPLTWADVFRTQLNHWRCMS